MRTLIIEFKREHKPPTAAKHLVIITSLSRGMLYVLIAFAKISSDTPFEYTFAVSQVFIPLSYAAFKIGRVSASLVTQGCQRESPKDIPPTMGLEILSPDEPRRVYSTFCLVSVIFRVVCIAIGKEFWMVVDNDIVVGYGVSLNTCTYRYELTWPLRIWDKELKANIRKVHRSTLDTNSVFWIYTSFKTAPAS